MSSIATSRSPVPSAYSSLPVACIQEKIPLLEAVQTVSSHILPKELSAIVAEYAYEASAKTVVSLVCKSLQESECVISRVPRMYLQVLSASCCNLRSLDISSVMFHLRKESLKDSLQVREESDDLASLQFLTTLGTICRETMPSLEEVVGRPHFRIYSPSHHTLIQDVLWIPSQSQEASSATNSFLDQFPNRVRLLSGACNPTNLVVKLAEPKSVDEVTGLTDSTARLALSEAA